jgi:serine phosphatase RsbU (regulator of sigma subunit)
MDDLKIKVWGMFYLSKKQMLIFELIFLTLFILLTVFLFSYEFPKHLDNDAMNFHGKYAKYISLLCTFLIVVETQFLWSKFTKIQLEKIKDQKDEIEKQKMQIERQNKDLKDSINYASKIQSALLPSVGKMERLLNNHFLYFKPRDIVSGDFYWVDDYQGKTIVAVADCTGHGVPGAFVSVLGISFLNDIVQKASLLNEDLNPAKILDELWDKMIGAFAKSETEEKTYDGMDIAVCIIDKEKKSIEYSGAMHPIYVVSSNGNGEKKLEQFRTDIHSISTLQSKKHSYSRLNVEVEEGDMIYMLSDGYADQFGGSNGSKFLPKNLKKLLAKIADDPLERQHLTLKEKIAKWKGSYRQIDDILILGIRV